MRIDGRAPDQLRPIVIERKYVNGPDGSALVHFGGTRVLCTASIEERVPPFLRDTGKGWVTAEYAMLPGSASGGRISRDATRKGRALEISRLIGRSLRACITLDRLGERQITVDCDVIQADGGTRTAAVTGGYVALHDAISALVTRGALETHVLKEQCAAVSVGIRAGEVLLDLCYEEDSSADVDLNLVMKDDGSIIEVQGTAEGQAFDRGQLDKMLDQGAQGIRKLMKFQRESLAGA